MPPIIAARHTKRQPRKTSPPPARPSPPASPLRAQKASPRQPSRQASRPRLQRRKASLDISHTAQEAERLGFRAVRMVALAVLLGVLRGVAIAQPAGSDLVSA